MRYREYILPFKELNLFVFFEIAPKRYWITQCHMLCFVCKMMLHTSSAYGYTYFLNRDDIAVKEIGSV